MQRNDSEERSSDLTTKLLTEIPDKMDNNIGIKNYAHTTDRKGSII